MANSITRYFKGIWYALIGRVHKHTDKLTNNPEALRDAYEFIIRFKREKIQHYKNAIGQLIALVESKKSSLKDLTDDIVELERIKTNATKKTETIVAEMQKTGTPAAEIEQHPEYVQCVTAYNDLHATLEEKNAHVVKLEQKIKRAQEEIESFKLEITSLHRDLDRIKKEQSEAAADLVEARERRDIADILAGIK